MDLEPETPRSRYHLCAAGFALTALALGLLCLDAALHLLFLMTRDFRIAAVGDHPWYPWLVGAPITWGSLIGSYLLWGRWPEPSWQRRAGLLVLMNGFDLLTWFFHNAELLGLPSNPQLQRLLAEHAWFLANLTHALGWAELAVFASLATDVLVHLERPGAPAAGQSARIFIAAGAVALVLSFLLQTDWDRNRLWPLASKRFVTPPIYLMILASSFLLTVASLQVTALSFEASRFCRRLLAEWRQADQRQHDLLRSRSESESDGTWR
jgi:hypothetical protein